MTEDWYGRHPLISDLIVLLSPGIIIFLIWMTFGLGLENSLIQAIATSIAIFSLLIYLKFKYNKKVLRYFNV